MKINKAIIGGTGVNKVPGLELIEKTSVETEYGVATIDVCQKEETKIAFLSRHGKKISIPPHKINYRANIMALKKIGVKEILTTTTVGSANNSIKPGSIVVIDDFLDFTKNREHTFFNKHDGLRDMTNPYSPELRQKIIKELKNRRITHYEKGVYACFEGPRFETAAEIKMVNIIGGDVTGMTNVPEVVLAMEVGIKYATVSIVVNWATGINENETVSKDKIFSVAENEKNEVLNIFVDIFCKNS